MATELFSGLLNPAAEERRRFALRKLAINLYTLNFRLP